MTLQSTSEAIIFAAVVLRKFDENHHLLTYFNAKFRDEPIPPELARSFAKRFDPHGSRSAECVALLYLSSLKQATDQAIKVSVTSIEADVSRQLFAMAQTQKK